MISWYLACSNISYIYRKATVFYWVFLLSANDPLDLHTCLQHMNVFGVFFLFLFLELEKEKKCICKCVFLLILTAVCNQKSWHGTVRKLEKLQLRQMYVTKCVCANK
ncbi:hypothetical protein Ancab_014225 [Ancistrocladus abbreviatus]